MNYCAFYCCYLIRSLKEGQQNKVYVGSTPDPQRRLRQHNGDLTQGAHKTLRHRPWEMVMFVYGFPTSQCALQFEWAWQHPRESRHVKRSQQDDDDYGAADRRQANLLLTKMRVVRGLLITRPFAQWPLKIWFLTAANQALFEAESSATLGRSLPRHIQLSNCPITQLSALSSSSTNDTLLDWFQSIPNSLSCFACMQSLDKKKTDSYVCCPKAVTGTCTMFAHLACLADMLLSGSAPLLIPVDGHCPACQAYLIWGDMIHDLRRRSALCSNSEEQTVT